MQKRGITEMVRLFHWLFPHPLLTLLLPLLLLLKPLLLLLKKRNNNRLCRILRKPPATAVFF